MKKIGLKGLRIVIISVLISVIFGAFCVSAENGVSDTTPPKGKISIGKGYYWTIFYEYAAYDFQLFRDVTFKFTAKDDDVAKIEYYKSFDVLTLEQAEALEESVWTEATELEAKVADEEQFYLYVRFTDEAGNQSIINTDGIVFTMPDEEEAEESPVTGQSLSVHIIVVAGVLLAMSVLSLTLVKQRRNI